MLQLNTLKTEVLSHVNRTKILGKSSPKRPLLNQLMTFSL